MAEALKVVLRVFPATKSSSRARTSGLSTVEKLPTLSPAVYQLVVHGSGPKQEVTGLTPFLKGILKCVGVGLSVITSNQLTRPSALLAKEVKSVHHTMAERKSGLKSHGLTSKHSLISKELDQDTIGIYRLLPPGKSISTLPGTKSKPEEGLPYSCWDSEAKSGFPLGFGPPHCECVDCGFEDPSIVEFEDFAASTKKQGDGDKPGDIEFKWQWIVNQERPSTHWLSPLPEQGDSKEESLCEDNDLKECAVGEVGKGLSESQKTPVRGGAELRAALSFDPAESIKSSKRLSSFTLKADSEKVVRNESLSWRTADRTELAILVSKKSHGNHLENCDLPYSKSSKSAAIMKGPSTLCDVSAKVLKSDTCMLADKLLLASLLPEYEPNYSTKNKSLAPLPLIVSMSEPTPGNDGSPSVSHPLTILSSSFQTLRPQDDRRKRRSGGRTTTETLGEALCHAQTRARRAEKIAAQALLDKEKVMQLLFREAWTNRTYKYWVHALEIENIWLRMCAGSQRMEENYTLGSPFILEWIANDCWKLVQKCAPNYKTNPSSFWQQHKAQNWGGASGDNFLMQYTIGLAFALGLGFAGAGLMFGWSLGWVTFTY